MIFYSKVYEKEDLLDSLRENIGFRNSQNYVISKKTKVIVLQNFEFTTTTVNGKVLQKCEHIGKYTLVNKSKIFKENILNKMIFFGGFSSFLVLSIFAKSVIGTLFSLILLALLTYSYYKRNYNYIVLKDGNEIFYYKI